MRESATVRVAVELFQQLDVRNLPVVNAEREVRNGNVSRVLVRDPWPQRIRLVRGARRRMVCAYRRDSPTASARSVRTPALQAVGTMPAAPRTSQAMTQMDHTTVRHTRARPLVPSNEDLVRTLQEMSLFLEMADVEFKPRAYEKAAHAVSPLCWCRWGASTATSQLVMRS